jgi:hypothetical protein
MVGNHINYKHQKQNHKLQGKIYRLLQHDFKTGTNRISTFSFLIFSNTNCETTQDSIRLMNSQYD